MRHESSKGDLHLSQQLTISAWINFPSPTRVCAVHKKSSLLLSAICCSANHFEKHMPSCYKESVKRAATSLYLEGRLCRKWKYILFSKAKTLKGILHNTQNRTLVLPPTPFIYTALSFLSQGIKEGEISGVASELFWKLLNLKLSSCTWPHVFPSLQMCWKNVPSGT